MRPFSSFSAVVFKITRES